MDKRQLDVHARLPHLVYYVRQSIPDAEIEWDHHKHEDLFLVLVRRGNREYAVEATWAEGVDFLEFDKEYRKSVDGLIARVSQLAEESGLNP
jgi:hypothetical protein